MAVEVTAPTSNGDASPSAKSDPMAELEQVDAILQGLDAKRREWATLPLSKKLALLKEVRARFVDQMNSWSKAGAMVRGVANDPGLVSVEMLFNDFIPGTYINKLLATLGALERTGSLLPPPAVRELPGGQLAVSVFPLTRADKLSPLAVGVTAELHLLPGAQLEQDASALGNKEGGLCAILGAGNYGVLGLKDLFVTLYEHNEVAVLKHHPMWGEWAAFADYALQPLASRGYCATLLCGHEATAHLMRHPLLTHAHMIGGTATHDLLAWGATPEEQARRKAANDPLIKVPFTSELGCVTPCIVAPGGGWTSAQLDAYAASIAEMAFNNASCNCNSVKVLLLPEGCDKADDLYRRIKEVMHRYPLKPAFYPGICQRHDAFREHYPNAEVITPTVAPTTPSRAMPGPQDNLPWVINELPSVPQRPDSEYALQTEPFAPVLTVLRLPAPSVEEFLKGAVEFANEGLWGTLSANIVVHPDVEAAHPDAVQAAVQNLRYGTVAINTWAAAVVGVGSGTWGAFAGNQTIADIGSGSGPYGNPLFVSNVQKSIVRSAFAGPAIVKPVWMAVPPRPLLAAIAGANANGIAGMLKALFWAK